MRIMNLAITTLCLMLTVSPVLAKEKKHDKQMDPQAMMELWKQAATPGEPLQGKSRLWSPWWKR